MACLHILNSKTGKSDRVMKLIRTIVLWSLQYDFHINAMHVILSQLTISLIQSLGSSGPCQQADSEPIPVPAEFWERLPVR